MAANLPSFDETSFQFDASRSTAFSVAGGREFCARPDMAANNSRQPDRTELLPDIRNEFDGIQCIASTRRRRLKCNPEPDAFNNPGLIFDGTRHPLYVLGNRKECAVTKRMSHALRRVGMKYLVTICALLISTPSIVSAQQGGKLNRAETIEAEHRLSEMGYWTGAVDGLFDTASRSALIAFQKWEGRRVTGQLTLEELEAIRTSSRPKAREPGYAHVEVDLDRQVLLLVNDEDRVRVVPVSTGSGEPFVDEGQTSIAYTPRGRFLVYRKDIGWQSGPLGSTYYANFISGSVAIHGSRSVPFQPASHGCIRVPVFAAREMSKLLTIGTIVLVYDKVSFVSAKSWAENPGLKQAALSSALANDSGAR